MIFVQFFQFLGDHIPALGAFLLCLIVVSGWSFLVAKLARRAADKRWTYQVEHMPQVIGQDVRERLERRIVELGARVKWLEARNDQMMPAFKSLAVIAEHFVEESKE